MLKRFSKVFLVLTMILSLVFGQGSRVVAASQDDIATIKTRLKTYFLALDTIDDGSKVETCYVSHAEEYLNLIQADGSFADVDYQAHNNAANGAAWSPYLALDRLQAIAIAYHKQGNALYQKAEAKDGVDKALKYWVTQGKRDKLPDGPYSTNWWENQVGVQLRFARIGLFMEGIISEESFKIVTDKLVEKTPEEYGTGQNNLWFDQNHVYHALLTNNPTRLKEMVNDYLNYCLSTQSDDQTAEAVQVDNSFYMHGKQFYSNGYGMTLFRDMSFWIYILRDTEFAIGQDVVDRMADYMLDGTSWTIRGDIMELYLGYRPYKFDVGYQNYAQEYIEPLKRMIESDAKNASRYQAVLDNIQGNKVSNGKNGNHYMWRSGYASHMRDGYGVNIKMDSKDIIGGEWRGSTQKKGQLIYWTSSAASSITVDGDEYTKVYPTFDWAHVPGTTTANRIVADFSNYGRFTNGTDHTIGVSNGKYGSTAYVMDKKETQASKGYFFFDDEFVALGAGIHSKESVNIHTTLNQSKAKNVIANGNNVPTGTKEKSYTGQWLHNDKTGYVFPKETTVYISNRQQTEKPSLWEQKEIDGTPETFTAWIDHGMKPKDASYEYIVLPNKTSQEVEQYSKNNPIQIVANTKDVQAVRYDGLKQTQIHFYKAGSLEYKDGHTVTVDYPCSMIIDESSETRKITVAVNDQSAHQVINVQLESNNVKTSTVFTTQGLPYAGQSSILTEGQDNRYHASSSTDGHPVKNGVDGNESTYWESQGNNSEWISLFAGSGKYIKDIDILWSQDYATQYDVYASKDGLDYQKIKSVTEGKGGKETITISGLYKYIKLVMNDSKGSHYQIKEVTFHASQLLSLNKTVEVSSTSSHDPGNVKENAVDGNLNTRWSSLRMESGFDKQEEWISVDLGRKARIDAIEILWEGAHSNKYSIEVSDDKKTWRPVKQNLKANSSLKDQMVLDEMTEARYVRIHSYSSATKYGISIYELSIYGQYMSKNIAFNKAVEASSIYDSEAAMKSVDGDTTSKWSSSRKNSGFNTQEEWINVDLGDISYIDGVEIDWESGSSDDYSIQVSHDNKTWTTVKEHLKSNTVASTDKHFIDHIPFEKPLEARYVKIYSYSSRTRYGINIWELKVLGEVKEISEPEPKPEPEGTNIALNKTVDSRSYYNDETVTKAAVDGNTATKWSSSRKNSGFNTQEEWISVDLGDISSIDDIVIDWESGSSDDYSIQVSHDNKTWTTVKEHLKSNTVASTDKHFIDHISFEKPLEARYVKIYSYSSRTRYGINIWELKVLGEIKETSEPEEVNIALNKPSIASSERTNPTTGFVLESKYAFDGSIENRGNTFQSRWVSATRKDNPGVNVDSQYIQVDLEGVYDLTKIVLNWEGACGKEYKLQVSEDGQTWIDISHITDGQAGIKEFTYDKTVIGRYVRMLGIEPVGQYGYSLWEFEVYGTSLKAELKEYYDQNKNIDVSIYTPKSAAAYHDALNQVTEVYKDKDATSLEILNTKKKLQNAINNLTLKADKTILKNIIKKANDISTDVYTEKTVKVFNIALKEAKNVNADENATQKQVTEMTSSLQKAIDGLIKKANKDALLAEMKNAESIEKEKYTKETIKNLETALKQANQIIQDAHVSQDEVNKAVNTLKKAIQALEKKKDEPIIIVPEDSSIITIHNSNHNINVKGKLPKDVKLSTQVFNHHQINQIREQINKQNPQFIKTAHLEQVYDFQLLFNQEDYKINGELEMTFELDESLKEKNLGIIYIDHLGNITQIPAIRKGNKLIATVTHFSIYAIVSYDQGKEDEMTESIVPQTEDTSSLITHLSMVIGSVLVGYMLLKKKKEDF